jgi:hypothetical protein
MAAILLSPMGLFGIYVQVVQFLEREVPEYCQPVPMKNM